MTDVYKRLPIPNTAFELLQAYPTAERFRLMSPLKQKKQSGFTLVELGISAVIMAIMATIGLYYLSQQMSYQVAHSQTDQLSVLSQALSRYQVKYSANITGGTAVPGVANATTPTVAELQTLGLLDTGFSPKNLFSPLANGYANKLTVTGCPANCSVFGLSYLTTPIIDSKGKVDDAALGEAITYGGGDIGASNELDVANVKGAQGSWVTPTPIPGVAGILAKRSGDGASGIPYLPLDGSGTMRGGLKMGGFDITAANNVAATGAVTAANVTASNTVAGATITASGAVNGATMTASGLIKGGTVTSTGAVNAVSVSASGGISGASVAASGAITGATMTATGLVKGGTVTASGGVSGATVSATGAVSGATLSATGAISGATLATTGDMTGQNITARGGLYSASVTSTTIVGTNINATGQLSTSNLVANTATVPGTTTLRGNTQAYSTIDVNTNTYGVATHDAGGGNNAAAQSAIGSVSVNDVYLRSIGKWASQLAVVTPPPPPPATGFTSWNGYAPANGYTPTDGILAVTSCLNTELIIYVNGVERARESARDKYGQGVNSATVPLMKGDSWSITGACMIGLMSS